MPDLLTKLKRFFFPDPRGYPIGDDVFRLSDLTTFVLVTERFVNAIDAVGGARANFEPVEIE